jgi:hypothetical protein
LDCAKCAVGNLCGGWADWGILLLYETWSSGEKFWPAVIKEAEKRSGYKVHELQIIEDAFENANEGNSREDWMYNGLVAVLDVLKEIHEVTDEDLAISKQRFAAHHQSKLQTV